MKIHSKREVQHIPDNHSGDIHYKDFLNIYRKYAIESYSFFTIDITLSAGNPLLCRKNYFDSL